MLLEVTTKRSQCLQGEGIRTAYRQIQIAIKRVYKKSYYNGHWRCIECLKWLDPVKDQAEIHSTSATQKIHEPCPKNMGGLSYIRMNGRGRDNRRMRQAKIKRY